MLGGHRGRRECGGMKVDARTRGGGMWGPERDVRDTGVWRRAPGEVQGHRGMQVDMLGEGRGKWGTGTWVDVGDEGGGGGRVGQRGTGTQGGTEGMWTDGGMGNVGDEGGREDEGTEEGLQERAGSTLFRGRSAAMAEGNRPHGQRQPGVCRAQGGPSWAARPGLPPLAHSHGRERLRLRRAPWGAATGKVRQAA